MKNVQPLYSDRLSLSIRLAILLAVLDAGHH